MLFLVVSPEDNFLICLSQTDKRIRIMLAFLVFLIYNRLCIYTKNTKTKRNSGKPKESGGFEVLPFASVC